jgi:mRNA interferase RelE/StbE
MMQILYSEKAAKSLKKISKGDKKSAKMIINAIEKYASDPVGNYDIKFLKGNFGEFKRLRLGNYRIIFDEDNNILYIYEIKHRQGAYND